VSTAVDTGPAVDVQEYTSFSPAIDLVAVHKRPIQGILIVAASAGATIDVTMPDGTATRQLNVAAGEWLPIRANTIETVSGVTRVRVYWGQY